MKLPADLLSALVSELTQAEFTSKLHDLKMWEVDGFNHLCFARFGLEIDVDSTVRFAAREINARWTSTRIQSMLKLTDRAQIASYTNLQIEILANFVRLFALSTEELVVEIKKSA